MPLSGTVCSQHFVQFRSCTTLSAIFFSKSQILRTSLNTANEMTVFTIPDFKKVLIYSLNIETEIMNVGRSDFLNHLLVFCVPFKSYTALVTDLYLILLGTRHSHYFCLANLVIHIPCNTRSFGLWIDY